MRELFPGILCWSRFSEPHGYDFNGTLVLSAEGNLCIDPVEPGPEVLDWLEGEGVGRILITNRNHTRAANGVRERTGARVAIHSADAEHARGEGLEADDVLEIGQVVGPFQVVGAAGKSPGEIALYDAARRLLVVGDAVIGNPAGRLSFLRDQVLDDPAELRASVSRWLEMDVDAVVVGDGVSILEGAGQALKKLVASIPH